MVVYTNPGPIEFDAVIRQGRQANSQAHVTFPLSVLETYGTRGRVPVNAWFDGVAYRGSLVTYGGDHQIPVLREVLATIAEKRPAR